MHTLLNILFLDNPGVPEQIYTFCSQLPEFQKAERDYELSAAELRARLGDKDYDTFEETLFWYLAQYSRAYYLFGLGLRQEVLEAMGAEG